MFWQSRPSKLEADKRGVKIEPLKKFKKKMLARLNPTASEAGTSSKEARLNLTLQFCKKVYAPSQ